MSADQRDERTVVRTYVPAYQKEAWQEHADELDMSQSEFVRTMVQAGRSGFQPTESNTQRVGNDRTAEEGRSPDVTPGVNGLQDRVLQTLADGEYYDWEELMTELTDGIEERLDETLQELQSSGQVRYSGRHGGYVLDE